jgi:hypothetical protein
MNLPNKSGFYWAKTRGMKWFKAIVQVYGESPFFKINGYDFRHDKKFSELSEIDEFGEVIKEIE